MSDCSRKWTRPEFCCCEFALMTACCFRLRLDVHLSKTRGIGTSLTPTLSLRRTGQAEEEADVVIGADVAAGVQRQDAGLGHEVVHHREDALLHLPRVLRAQNDLRRAICHDQVCAGLKALHVELYRRVRTLQDMEPNQEWILPASADSMRL